MSDAIAVSTMKCGTCAHWKPVSVSSRDPLSGKYRVCALDTNPGARYANPDLACRLVPIRWVAA